MLPATPPQSTVLPTPQQQFEVKSTLSFPAKSHEDDAKQEFLTQCVEWPIQHGFTNGKCTAVFPFGMAIFLTNKKSKSFYLITPTTGTPQQIALPSILADTEIICATACCATALTQSIDPEENGNYENENMLIVAVAGAYRGQAQNKQPRKSFMNIYGSRVPLSVSALEESLAVPTLLAVFDDVEKHTLTFNPAEVTYSKILGTEDHVNLLLVGDGSVHVYRRLTGQGFREITGDNHPLPEFDLGSKKVILTFRVFPPTEPDAQNYGFVQTFAAGCQDGDIKILTLSQDSSNGPVNRATRVFSLPGVISSLSFFVPFFQEGSAKLDQGNVHKISLCVGSAYGYGVVYESIEESDYVFLEESDLHDSVLCVFQTSDLLFLGTYQGMVLVYKSLVQHRQEDEKNGADNSNQFKLITKKNLMMPVYAFNFVSYTQILVTCLKCIRLMRIVFPKSESGSELNSGVQLADE